MIGSIIIKHNPVTAWETYHRELHRAYEGGPGFSGYRHSIRAVGGFWDCRFTMHGRLDDLLEFQASGHGRHVEVYGERGAKCWEGLIVEMEIALGEGQLASISILCYGYFRTLYWRTYNQTALTTDTNLSSIIQAVLTACGQFIASSSIETNVTQVNQQYDSDRQAGDVVASLAGLGDMAYNRYAIGVYEDRKCIYERAPRARLLGY